MERARSRDYETFPSRTRCLTSGKWPGLTTRPTMPQPGSDSRLLAAHPGADPVRTRGTRYDGALGRRHQTLLTAGRAIAQAAADIEGHGLEKRPSNRVARRPWWCRPRYPIGTFIRPTRAQVWSIWFARPWSPVMSQPVNHSMPLARLCAVGGPTTSSTASVRGSMLTAASASPDDPRTPTTVLAFGPGHDCDDSQPDPPIMGRDTRFPPGRVAGRGPRLP
jgi:hypothetical protein